MQKPFWPTTGMGRWALATGSIVGVCLVVFSIAPTVLQSLFREGSYDALLTGSVGFLGLCMVAAGFALVALLRGHDRGWSVYLALLPMLYVCLVLLGVVNE